jgi:spermidine synthase
MSSTNASSMIASATPQPGFIRRLFGVGLVVFVANAGLLVLQLVAGRLLSPFIGSSLETWTSVIAAFLAGIAAGNAYGGRIADRSASGIKLAAFLALGGLAALWTIGLPYLLGATGGYSTIPLGLRIPILALVLCFPVAFALSVLTPLAIRIGVPDVRNTGLVSGLVFGLSTLGCLLGNYITGFILIPEYSVNQIVIGTATVLFVTAATTLGLGGEGSTKEQKPSFIPHPAIDLPPRPISALPILAACTAAALCSVAGMTLELTAIRLLAPVLGVSIYTWTGVIGVMLAGTCLGNWAGGLLADTGGSKGNPDGRRFKAAICILIASGLIVLVILTFGSLTDNDWLRGFDLVSQILLTTFSLFFLPMFLLGTISPQLIRLAVADLSDSGQTAGRVYAWSTAGAIVGTLATGYLLISTFGVLRTLFLTAIIPALASVLVVSPRQQPRMLYALCAMGGILVGGGYTLFKSKQMSTAESNYYTIRVVNIPSYTKDQDPLLSVIGPAAVVPRDLRWMSLDHLIHSVADANDPTFLHYEHEQIQLEAVLAASVDHPAEQRVLVIGGGGYTFPRCVKTLVPTSKVEVVEIDPAVTAAAIKHMGFDPALATSHHMDGRQFVAERATPNTYHVVTLDAVNDYSVPYHLLTKQCNEAVKKTLTTDGVYLVTVIDEIWDGRLWKAAYNTLKESFPHVTMAFSKGQFDPEEPNAQSRSVIVLYASERPLDIPTWSAARRKKLERASNVFAVPNELTQQMLAVEKKPILLTDQFSPVDNLMMQVFQKQ